MRRSAVLTAVLVTTASLGSIPAASWANDGLTPTESRWIDAASPVLDYAAAQGLPIDIIVQPKAGPNDVSLAMGFEGGRCKLVMTLRGNPNAEASLQALSPAQQTLAIEAMAAHEVAHCWRRLSGDWRRLPAGFTSSATASREQRMQETRREEGLADLFGLAWMQKNHPADYAQVHTWFEQVRGHESVPGSHHDTLAWIEMARNPAVFDAKQTPFQQAKSVWTRALNEKI